MALSGKTCFGAVIVLWITLAADLHSQAQTDAEARVELINSYCITCHSAAAKAGGLVLQGVDPVASANPALWEKVIGKVSSGEMPPPGRPRPDADALRQFTAALTHDLDAYAVEKPYAGSPVIRRLNRTEYGNVIRDLLALDIDVAGELPEDGLAAGFDNIGDALSMSPVLLERYLKLARRITDLAIGVGESSPVTHQFVPAKTQAAWQAGEAPFGTRGGIAIRHYFPRNAEYSLRVFVNTNGGELTPVEGVRFFQFRLPLTAGAHTFVATFPDEFAAREGPAANVRGAGGPPMGGPVDPEASAIKPVIDFLVDGQRVKRFEIAGALRSEIAFGAPPGPPVLDRAEISGPYNPTGVGRTPSRDRIFICRPAAAVDELPCATKILSAIVRRAFRRDVSALEVTPFVEAYKRSRTRSSFDDSIAAAIRRVLVAPEFLFRLEIDPRSAAGGAVQPLSGFELASRLSFFVWSSIPDDNLLNAASKGRLADAAVVREQVSRMLADSRAQALVDDFAAQWLGLRGIRNVQPDPAVYPEFDDTLGGDFQQETQLFVESIIRENRSVLDFVAGDYTYLNERLAKHYRIPGVTGPGFRRVSLANTPERAGLLTQGSILLLTSHPTRTSPVLRGNWILTYLLNSPSAPPPAGVPPLEESAVQGQQLTTRQQIERHRRNPACATCHVRIDPLGFALETFDVIGRVRTEDAGGAIDPSSRLPTGETLDGPPGLKRLILSREEDFAAATVARLMTYALGRQLDARDQPEVRRIVRDTKAGRYKFHDLVLGIINSVPFRMRQTQEHL